MQELEHIVKELKARSSFSLSGGPSEEDANTGSNKVAPAATAPSPGAAERVAHVNRAVADAAPPLPPKEDLLRAEPAKPAQMPQRAEPLRAERDVEPVAQAVRDEMSARRVEPAPARAQEDGAAVAASKPAGEAAGASPKRAGRKLFSDTQPTQRSGGSGGGGTPPNDGDERDEPRGMPFWINALGAAAAVALIVGVGLWTYQLGQRDAMEVPIVRALEGPVRVEPQDPGGAQIAHQGLAVNEVLDGGGVASVAQTVRTAPGEEGAQPEDKAAGALVGLSEATSPTRRPFSTVGANADTDSRAAVAIDDVLAMAHERLAHAQQTDPADSEEAERAAIDAIVSAIAKREGAALPQVDAQSEADAIQAAERKAAEEAAQVVAAAQADVATPNTTETGAEVTIAGTGAGVSRPPLGVEGEVSATPEVAQAADPVVPAEADATDAEEPILLAAVALTPTPPAGEGSAFAPVSQSQPRARPRGLADQMRAAVDAAVGTGAVAQPVVQEEPAPVQTASVEPAAVPSDANGASEAIPLPAGTRMIQIGAFDSPTIAEQQWTRFASLHSDLLGAKRHYVQRTNNSGRIFYRLRVAGYESKEETRAACSALSARGLPCISVTLR